LRRSVERLITVACWACYLYLVMPLVTLLCWLVGLHVFVDEFVSNRGYEGLFQALRFGGLGALGVLLLFLAWIRYNYWLFNRHGERRSSRSQVSNDADLALLLGVTVAQMAALRAARTVQLHVEDDRFRVVSAIP
jgi:poly-beta-1,6-N-acetyl-D-glucosamine biosynthesis protein PgaD